MVSGIHFNADAEHLWCYIPDSIVHFAMMAMLLKFPKNAYCLIWAYFEFWYCSVFFVLSLFAVRLVPSGYLASFVSHTWQSCSQLRTADQAARIRCQNTKCQASSLVFLLKWKKKRKIKKCLCTFLLHSIVCYFIIHFQNVTEMVTSLKNIKLDGASFRSFNMQPVSSWQVFCFLFISKFFGGWRLVTVGVQHPNQWMEKISNGVNVPQHLKSWCHYQKLCVCVRVCHYLAKLYFNTPTSSASSGKELGICMCIEEEGYTSLYGISVSQ